MELPEPIEPNQTHIYLPFKEAIEFSPVDLFDHIDNVLLFLHKLCRIELTLEDKSMKKILTKSISNQRCKITIDVSSPEATSSKELEFIVCSTEILVPKELQVELSKGKKTEIVLAFPISEGHMNNSYPIYTFLPVQTVGFRFIIQADFDLTTNRQEVHTNKPWNQWLRGHIARLFFNSLKENSYLKERLQLYMPAPREIADPFWLPIAEEIRALVSQDDCVLTESGSWRRVSEVLLRPEHYDKLISNEELLISLQKEFVASSVDRAYAVHTLQCKEFDVSDLMACITHSGFLLESKENAWISDLYSFLQLNLRELDRFMDRLREIPIFKVPEKGGTVKFTSLNEGPIYLSLPPSSTPYRLGATVRLLTKDLASELNMKFLDRMGIVPASVDQVWEVILFHHMKARGQSDKLRLHFDHLPHTIAWQQLRFIKDHIDHILSLPMITWERLQASLCIPADDGGYYDAGIMYPFKRI
jgi:hypothetical protein